MKKILTVLIGVFASLALIGVVLTTQDRREADRILQTVQTIEIGSIMTSRQARAAGFSEANCTLDHCSFEREIENRWLRIFGLAPRTIFKAVVATSKNRVVGFSVGIGQEGGGEVTVSDSAQDFANLKPFNVLEKDRSIDVFLTPRSTEAERLAALDLNLSALSHFGFLLRPSELYKSHLPHPRE